jgi:acetyl-CoA synthetase (ADP-forming)
MKPSQIFKKAKKDKRKSLLEFEARQVLGQYKIPLAKWGLAKKVIDATTLSKKIGFPVTLKIVSRDIVHKADVGGVLLNLNSEKEVEQAFNQIIKNVKKYKPKARIDGILVQKMIKDGQEIIVGGKKDPQFGQILMFGGGGVLVELLEDVAFRVVPVSKKDADEMMQETKFYQILNGFRGKKYDVNSVLDILLKTSKLLEQNPEIIELDLNPVIVCQKNAFAVDARIAVE